MNYKDILYFPKLLFTLVVQLVFYTLTEVETLLLAIVGVLVGLETNWRLGLLAYFSIYLLMRMTGGYVTMISNNLREIAAVRSRTDQ